MPRLRVLPVALSLVLPVTVSATVQIAEPVFRSTTTTYAAQATTAADALPTLSAEPGTHMTLVPAAEPGTHMTLVPAAEPGTHMTLVPANATIMV